MGIYIHVCHVYIYMMYSALCEYKGTEGNYLIPYYYYPLYYDYYSTILNTAYCLLDTGGATCGTPSTRHSLEPPLTPVKKELRALFRNALSAIQKKKTLQCQCQVWLLCLNVNNLWRALFQNMTSEHGITIATSVFGWCLTRFGKDLFIYTHV